MSKTGLVYDDRFIEHATGENHPECPERLQAIRDELMKFGVWEQCVPISARCATRAELMRCHTASYLNNIDGIAAIAAGGVLNAVDWVMEAPFRNALALVRPPGHHARRDGGGGFCIYNNIALGAMHALKKHSLEKIMIVDWDIHHGDGTQEAFYDRDDVLFFSIHRHNLYPPTGLSEETGEGKGKGYTVNINLDLGFGNGMYEAVFSKILEPILWSYQPQLVLVSAGFDAYYLDDLGLMKVTSEGFVRMAYRLKKLTERMGHGRLLFCLEGGYHIL
ncbi:MAG: histone deacetylase, partial [Desulfobacteraceae bacterium]